MPRHVTIHYERDLPHSIGEAYAWLTDFTDEDPTLTDAIVEKRPVLERSEDRVLLEGTLNLLGKRGTGKAEVRLFPPDRWEAHFIEGRGRGSVYEYRLVPRGPEGCRLVVDYRVRVKRFRGWLQVTLAKPAVRREIHRMWDGFCAAMARDLAKAERLA